MSLQYPNPLRAAKRDLRQPSTRVRWLVLACLAGVSLAGQAQMAEPSASELPAEPFKLKPTSLLQEAITPEQAKAAPVFLMGDRITGRTDLETVIEGDAVFRKPGTVIRADRLEYDQPTDTAKATGNVRINRGGNVYEGPLMELKVDAFEGFFKQPRYQFLQNDAHGEATRADFVDESHTVVHDATYTTCRRKPGPDWMPDWILRATSINLDNEEEVGVAHGAVLSFKGVPVLPVPAISFPLTDKRKSGVLPPSWAVDSVNGMQLGLPYYWNIAPNRDATITPTLMTARGVNVGTEFRYLEPTYSGAVRADFMTSDKLRDADRWGLAYNHTGTVATGLPSVPSIGLVANINRVSDDNYWRDFTSTSATLTQRLLPSTVTTTWASGPVSGTAAVLKWQTLQDLTAPIAPPYDRVPQLTARTGQTNVRGLDWSVDGDFTQFAADWSRSGLTNPDPNAQRAVALLQVSRPWLAPAGFITPKLQLHATAYQFDTALANGARAADSVVPTFSLDSGLVFEREASLMGRNLVQTLEPRAFYVNTPYRNQRLLPNYDTGVNDFNFATIFTENAFGGNDKISDNNLLTLGLTTRLIDADSGAQLARFGIAQRLRFEDQLVTLNSATEPAKAGFSDVMLGASIDLMNRWALDSTVQYNGKTEQSVRSTVGARYSPGNYRVLNAAYRFQRDVSELVDVSWQWPITNPFADTAPSTAAAGRGLGEGRYYGVGRLNYSLIDRRLVDTVLGVEYDAGCWLGRVVLQRAQTSATSATERLMFQLEFVGFTKLGVSPQQTLLQNISRYQNLRESGTSNSRFSNYD